MVCHYLTIIGVWQKRMDLLCNTYMNSSIYFGVMILKLSSAGRFSWAYDKNKTCARKISPLISWKIQLSNQNNILPCFSFTHWVILQIGSLCEMPDKCRAYKLYIDCTLNVMIAGHVPLIWLFVMASHVGFFHVDLHFQIYI